MSKQLDASPASRPVRHGLFSSFPLFFAFSFSYPRLLVDARVTFGLYLAIDWETGDKNGFP